MSGEVKLASDQVVLRYLQDGAWKTRNLTGPTELITQAAEFRIKDGARELAIRPKSVTIAIDDAGVGTTWLTGEIKSTSVSARLKKAFNAEGEEGQQIIVFFLMALVWLLIVSLISLITSAGPLGMLGLLASYSTWACYAALVYFLAMSVRANQKGDDFTVWLLSFVNVFLIGLALWLRYVVLADVKLAEWPGDYQAFGSSLVKLGSTAYATIVPYAGLLVALLKIVEWTLLNPIIGYAEKRHNKGLSFFPNKPK